MDFHCLLMCHEKIPVLPCTLQQCVLLSSGKYIPQHQMWGAAVCTCATWWAFPLFQQPPWRAAGCLKGRRGTCASQAWKAALFRPWGNNLLSLCEAEQKNWGPTVAGIPEHKMKVAWGYKKSSLLLSVSRWGLGGKVMGMLNVNSRHLLKWQQI